MLEHCSTDRIKLHSLIIQTSLFIWFCRELHGLSLEKKRARYQRNTQRLISPGAPVNTGRHKLRFRIEMDGSSLRPFQYSRRLVMTGQIEIKSISMVS